MRLVTGKLRLLGITLALVLIMALQSSCSYRSMVVRASQKGADQFRSAVSRLPNPFAVPDHVIMTKQDAARTFLETRVRPATTVTGERNLTFEACRQLALANNAEIRSLQMAELSSRVASISQAKLMFPHIDVTGTLSVANNQRWAYSEPLGNQGIKGYASVQDAIRRGVPPIQAQTGIGVYSSASERTTRHAATELNWSPTDAMQAYLMFRNARNDLLVSHYRRERKSQQVIRDTSAAYFRLLALQEIMPLVSELVALRSVILDHKTVAYNKRLVDLDDVADATDKNNRAQLSLERLTNELERQRNALASLLGISPGRAVDKGFRVAGKLSRPRMDLSLDNPATWDMERQGIENRPESYLATLDSLKAENELKGNRVRCYPNITGFWRPSWDKNHFFYEEDWKEWGLYLKWDLLEALASYDRLKAAELMIESRRDAFDATASGIASEVRQGVLKCGDAQAVARSNAKLLEIYENRLRLLQRKLAKGEARVAAVDEGRADVIEKKIELIRAIGEENAALAELEAALATNYREAPPFH
jgi:outer membrane protein TolC